MDETYYSVEQLSRMLHIHPKTIQRYIREGKLRAAKIGKSWRVTGNDLSRFTEEHSPTPDGQQEPREMTSASAVVDIAVRSAADGDRIASFLNGAMHSKPPEYGQASLVTQYLTSQGTLRLSLWGNVAFMAAVFSAVDTFLQQKEEEYNE